MLKSVLTFILAFSLLQTLSALDLLQQEKWVSWHKAKITRVKDADGQMQETATNDADGNVTYEYELIQR